MRSSDRPTKVSRLGPTLLAVLLVSCGPSLESAHFQPQSAVELAIANHYERYASEENGQCLRPYIKGLSRIEGPCANPAAMTSGTSPSAANARGINV